MWHTEWPSPKAQRGNRVNAALTSAPPMDAIRRLEKHDRAEKMNPIEVYACKWPAGKHG